MCLLVLYVLQICFQISKPSFKTTRKRNALVAIVVVLLLNCEMHFQDNKKKKIFGAPSVHPDVKLSYIKVAPSMLTNKNSLLSACSIQVC